MRIVRLSVARYDRFMIKIGAIRPASLRDLPIFLDARNEGFVPLQRLLDAAESGDEPFAAPNETFFGARRANDVIAVAGLSQDPYGAAATVGRLRHLYVRPNARRAGVGRSLVAALLEQHGRLHYRTVRLRTYDPGAAAFYEAIGFARTEGSHETHRVDLLDATDPDKAGIEP